ncbi:MAG: Bug family tripartite tricarboxylate transporter substrate binding protein, partial [Burkholderiales bacterium]
MAVDEVEPEGPEEFDMLTVDILVHAWAANAHERAWPAGSRAAVPCTRVRGKALPSKALLQHAALWLLASPFVAFAQATYPAKPIRWIVPFPPGGSTTIIARLMGQKLTEAWGQQVVVDNRGGGNTIIGSEAMVRSAPDGYTILQVTTTHVINPSLLATPYDAVKDFAPVGTLVATETLMVVTPSLPANNLQELIALAKAKPGQLNFGSSGSGT